MVEVDCFAASKKTKALLNNTHTTLSALLLMVDVCST